MQSVIKNRGKIKQVVDFGGLRYGSLYPTDIDGCIEYRNKAVLFFELKYGNAEMPDGQEMAFTRIVRDIQRSGKECALLLCSHNVADPNKDIDASQAVVRRVYWHGRWINVKDGRTLREQVEKYLAWVNSNPI